jgi:hypothetical protein
MSDEVETSQAELDLTALEGFRAGNQDLERLEALLDHFIIFEATGWYWGWLRGPVDAEEYRLLEGSSEMASLTITRKRGVRGDPARLSSRLHLHGWLLR